MFGALFVADECVQLFLEERTSNASDEEKLSFFFCVCVTEVSRLCASSNMSIKEVLADMESTHRDGEVPRKKAVGRHVTSPAANDHATAQTIRPVSAWKAVIFHLFDTPSWYSTAEVERKSTDSTAMIDRNILSSSDKPVAEQRIQVEELQLEQTR